MQTKMAVLALLIILVLVNWSILEKEAHLANGRIVYLELAPVDPRSLMQGDYMALRFSMADRIYSALPKTEKDKPWRRKVDAADGQVVVSLNEKKVASFKRIHAGEKLSAGELLLRYRIRNGVVKFATNGFFFEEGHAEYYEPARYGQFRVDEQGELLLVAMYDTGLNKLAALDKE